MSPPRTLLRLIRAIPPGTRGKRRLARALLRPFLHGAARVEDRYGCRYALACPAENVSFALMVDGVYEPLEVDLVVASLPPDGVFLDIGANIGCFALPVARSLARGGGRVVALEASAANFAALRANIGLNGLGNVIACHVAAAERDGTIEFHEMPAERAAMSTLTPVAGSEPATVAARRVDSLLAELAIDAVDLVKIDVEGHEASVLRGAQKLLTAPRAPTLVMEFVDWAEGLAGVGGPGTAQALLASWGYSIWRIDDFLARRAPLAAALTSGADTLVARKPA